MRFFGARRGTANEDDTVSGYGAVEVSAAAATKAREHSFEWHHRGDRFELLKVAVVSVGGQYAALGVIALNVFTTKEIFMKCDSREQGLPLAAVCECTKSCMRYFTLLAMVVSLLIALRLMARHRIYYQILRHGALLDFESCARLIAVAAAPREKASASTTSFPYAAAGAHHEEHSAKFVAEMWPARVLLDTRIQDEDSVAFRRVWYVVNGFVFPLTLLVLCFFMGQALKDVADVQEGQLEDVAALLVEVCFAAVSFYFLSHLYELMFLSVRSHLAGGAPQLRLTCMRPHIES